MIRRFFSSNRRAFDSLDEQEVLALAISSEEDDEKIYRAYADGLKDQFPNSAKIFNAMAAEESGHRKRLTDQYIKRFGDHIPLIRREHVKGFYERKPDWLVRPLGIDQVRQQAALMEQQSARFYEQAALKTQSAELRSLFHELALEENRHEQTAERLEQKFTPDDVKDSERAVEHKQRLLTWIQPGLAGLMDGSVSTLAPIFAAAFATGDTRQTFLVGLSASIGAGISMGFTEAAHDDGKLSGRGSPVKRGIASGVMTTIGGLGHALPYLIPHFALATFIACIIVFIELWVIAFIQNRYMETPFVKAVFQVVVGGVLVFLAGILIGNA